MFPREAQMMLTVVPAPFWQPYRSSTSVPPLFVPFSFSPSSALRLACVLQGVIILLIVSIYGFSMTKA